MDQQDVIVVGAGNAALCAALSAREAGARVTVLERAPVAERGGNSTFTAGAIRVAYGSVDDLVELIPDLSEEEKRTTDFGTYSEDQYFDDLARVTQHRGDPDLVELLVRRSHPTLKWLRGNGVRFVPIYGRQAFKVGGKFKFWGGLTVEVSGGGPGLVEALHTAAERAGIEVLYEARAVALLADDRGVTGVRVRQKGKTRELRAKAVILACGGFEANAEWRTRYLGPNWDLAKVRGTRFNTGDGIRMALEIGAQPRGNWSGCHAVSWDRNAPEFGDLAVGDQFQKHSYPFGIMINARGERFVDEGAEFRNYTYAKYGRAVLEQPGQFAWQIFDPDHQGRGRHHRAIGRASRRRRQAGVPAYRRGIQSRGAPRHSLRPQRQGRARRGGAENPQEQLGEHDRHPAVPGLRGDVRHHLHVRRAADHQ